MKIKKVYIGAFGALKDLTLDFSDGLQVIYGENEAGKTTVTEFIKSVFYGTGRRAAGQVLSVREKYAPFDGTPAGGRIFFEHSGKEYCIERQFRKSDATDKITLTDTASGKSETVPSDIGKSLFGITMPAFERSVFIGNTPDFSFDEGAAGEINQKLTNTALTGEDGVSYQKVLNRLDDARLKLVSKSGRTGSLVADIARHNELIEQLGEADAAARRKQELTRGIKEADADLAEINKKSDVLGKLLEREKDIENAEKLKEYIETKARLDTLTKQLTLPDGTVADEMFLKKFEFVSSKIAKSEEKLKEEEQTLASLNSAASAREGSTPDEIRQKLDDAKEEFSKCEVRRREAESDVARLESEVAEEREAVAAAKDKKKPVNPVFLTAGVALLVAGIAVLLLSGNRPAAIGAFSLGAVAVILGFIVRPKNGAALASAENGLAAKQNELTAKKSELMMINGEKSNIEAKIENLNVSLNFGVNEEQKIKETEERLAAEKERLKEEKGKAANFFGFKDIADLDRLKAEAEGLYGIAEEQKRLKLCLSYLSRDLGGISYEEAESRLNALGQDGKTADLAAAKEEADRLAARKAELSTVKTRLETELKTAFRGAGDPEDLRREIQALKEAIASKQAFYDAASAAHEVLAESLVTARASFGSALENETLKIFKELTGGAYDAVNISSDFDIKAEKTGVFGMHGIEHLSRGTKDQAYLALRLAVARLITEKEPLPVMLDDSLSQYDDNRFALALKFLKEYAESTQISLFTCHKFVTDEAKRQGIKTVEL